MNSLTKFKGVYCSGIFIPNPATITALSLLFEKVYLPNNIEIVKEFSKKYKIKVNKKPKDDFSIDIKSLGHDEDPFAELTEQQKITAFQYLEWGIRFTFSYGQLFSEVFETKLFSKNQPLKVKLIKKGNPGELNLYEVSRKSLTLTGEDEDTFPNLISKGYIPVVGNIHSTALNSSSIDSYTAKQLASLLAMKSIEMLLPPTKGVHPQIILEARDRLSDHLPPFWSAMLKLSVQMKQQIRECKTAIEVNREAQETIDTIVLPALIDLKEKMIKEEKDWFYKILVPIQKGLRLLIGNPPLTQQQLITSALVLGADVAMSTAENMRTIDTLKRESGLTFLLEADKVLNKSAKKNP